jgi:hypothetical protein
MRFKPIKYNSGEGLAKIRIEEESGALMENWTIMMSDLGTWFRTMQEKYGDQIDNKKEKKIDHDLDWLK